MDRIATASAYNGVLANLLAAQQAQSTATNQISSQKNATDLKGYAGQAETLTAMQAVQTQTTGYLDQSQVTAARLSSQDLGLTQLNTSASGAVTSITQALASSSGQTLMQSLQSDFQSAVSGLNTTYNGEYVFSGGQVNTKATSATSLSDLTTPAATADINSLFNNDQHVTATQLNSSTTMQTGFLANNLGGSLYTAFQAIVAYNAGPNGPFGNPLTDTQTAWLQAQIPTLKSINTDLTTTQAQNGLNQKEVTNIQTDLTNQQTTMSGLIGNITDVNLAQATANLQQAQLAVQASGQAFIALQSSSLLSTLISTGH
jgi:flagellar hook-associated protein 3 FlgL